MPPTLPGLGALRGRLLPAMVLLTLGLPALAAATDRAPIELALAVPLTGQQASTGQALVRAVRLQISSVNAQGGIAGHPVRLKIYDDRGTPSGAVEVAQQIADRDRAVAVVGHWLSRCSIAAGEIYRRAGIVAVTQGAVRDDVTTGNPWYFSTIYSVSFSVELLAHYILRVLKVNQVVVLQEREPFGQQFGTAFAAAAERSGLKVVLHQDLPSGPLEPVLERVKSLGPPAGSRAILIASQASAGASAVRAIRDAGIEDTIIGPSSFAQASFVDALDALVAGGEGASYYTHGIFVTTPWLLAAANEQARTFFDTYVEAFDRRPDWTAVFAYDTAQVVTDALAHVVEPADVSAEVHGALRERLRARLAAMNRPHLGFEGATGLTFFNAEGSADKPPVMGVYDGTHLLPALTQLRPVPRPYATVSEKDSVDPRRLVVVDDVYLHTTDVISTGVEILAIRNIQPRDLSFEAEFFVWMRHSSGSHPEALQFMNTLGPVEVSDPVQRMDRGRQIYELYRVKGTFRADSLAHHLVRRHVDLPIQFRHKSVPRSEMLYMVDGSRAAGGGESAKLELHPSSGWQAKGVRHFQSVARTSALGAPYHSGVDDAGGVSFSQFNVAVTVEPSGLTPGRLLSGPMATALVVLALLGLLVVGLLWRRRPGRWAATLCFGLLTVSSTVGLVAAEVALSYGILQRSEAALIATMGRAFDSLWWVVAALVLNAAVSTFVWTPVEEQTGHPVPKTVRRLCLLTLLVFALFGVLAFVFDQKITSLLATSGVVAMIVGLAIQINISNIVSGLILNMERPFRIGDWIQVGEHTGRVVDINWRATRVQTSYDNTISIPNTKVAESVVQNYHYPSPESWYGFMVRVGREHTPDTIRQLLQNAVGQTEGVLEPWIIFEGLSDWSADYSVYYRARDFSLRFAMKDRVWNTVWAALRAHGISPATPQHRVEIGGAAASGASVTGVEHGVFQGSMSSSVQASIDPDTPRDALRSTPFSHGHELPTDSGCALPSFED